MLNGILNLLIKLKLALKHNVVKIIQRWLFGGKGINPEDFTGEFTTNTAAAVVELKKDAGIKDEHQQQCETRIL